MMFPTNPCVAVVVGDVAVDSFGHVGRVRGWRLHGYHD